MDRSKGPFPATSFIVAGTMSQQKKDHMIVLKLENMHVTDTNMTEDDEEESDPGTFKVNGSKVVIFLSGGQFCIFFSKLVRDIDLILFAS